MRGVVGSAIGLLLLFGRPPTPAVSAASQDRPVFRAGVDVVRIDVSVLDKDRRPVRDLTANDVTILVDGVPQPVVAFVPVVHPPRESPTADWMRDVTSDVRANGPDEPRLFVIVMDDFNTPPTPYAVETGKAIARAVVDEMGDSDLASVLFTLNRRQGQELTNDRARLLQAIDRFGVGFPASFVGGTALGRTITDAHAFLCDRPYNRGAIILIGSMGKLGPNTLEQLESNRLRSEATLTDDIRGLGTEARLGRVPIYWFSTTGLAAPEGGTGASFIDVDDYYRTVAALTGGRAVGDTNAPVDAVPDVIAENSVYCIVGYRPTYPAADGRVRRLRIKVDRPGVTVSPDERSIRTPLPPKKTKKLPAPTERAIADIVPRTDFPLQVAAAAFARPAGSPRGTPPAAVAVSVGVRRPSPDRPLVEHVEFLGRLFTIPDGKAAASTQSEARVELVPGDGGAEFELLSRLDVKPGRYQLRVSVRSATLDQTASVYADVTVPDFSKQPLSLSGVVVGTTPAPKSAPPGAFSALTPVTPTTRRDFTSADQAVVFVRIYQGGKRAPVPVDVRATITDDLDQVVVSETDVLPPGLFGSRRSTGHTWDIPLERLRPGAYLLTIAATGGPASAGPAHVRFRMR